MEYKWNKQQEVRGAGGILEQLQSQTEKIILQRLSVKEWWTTDVCYKAWERKRPKSEIV